MEVGDELSDSVKLRRIVANRHLPPANTLLTKPQAHGVPALPKHPSSAPLSTKTPPGSYVHAQDASGVVHVVPNGPGLYPTILGSGQPTAAAGEIMIDPGGVVTEINNISYTFQHSSAVLPGVQSAVERQGFAMAPGALKPFQR
jgi:hypothetical protein